LTVTPGWDYGLGQASFTLAWSPPVSAGDASTYTVYRATAPAGPTTMVVNNLTATSYVDEGGGTSLTPTAAYYYSVLDVNGVGAFSAATPAAAATAYPPLPGLSGLSVVGQGGGLFAAWNPLSPSSGVNGYYLNVSTLAGAQVASLVVPASQNTAFVALTGTALHMTLTVQVGGLNSAGQGPTLVAQGFANNALNGQVVQGVTGTVGYYEATTGAARVVLDFATPTSGTTLLYRDIAPVLVTESAGGPASPFYLAEVDGLDSYVDTTVAVFTNYYYAFTSLNKPGLPGGESPPVQLGPLSPIVAAGPGAISGTAGNGRVDLVYSAPASWGTHGPPGSASATAFLLYRQGAKATAAAPVGPSLTAADPGFPVSLSLASSAYTDTNVVNGYAYNYYLKAVDGAGWPSDQWAYPHLAAPYEDDIAPMVPLAPQPPPQNVTAVAGDASVTLRWVASQADADTSAFGGSSGTYNVYRRQVGAPNVGYTLLPWLQHVGPVPQDYSGGGTTNGLLVSTLTDPPEADFVSVPPYAPVDLQEYCYSISTVNSRGEGPKGPEVCITPFKPLAAPLNVSVTVAEGAYSRKSLFIGWSPPVANPVTYTGYPLVGYEVLRSSDEGTTYTLVNPSVNAGMVTGTSEVDSSTKFGTSYLYRVVAIDQAGNEGLSSQLVPAIIPTGTDAIHLYRNAFDPAKGQSLPVQYSTEEPGHVWVKVYTLSGEYVATLFDETVQSASSASPYLSAKIFWPGTNNLGQTVASGVYLIHLEGSGFRANARVAVIK
ncbi:MAG TPA: hypothetical protein VNZ54_02320, partial [bacterium]|nr:hypothetical protein [bacterium]